MMPYNEVVPQEDPPKKTGTADNAITEQSTDEWIAAAFDGPDPFEVAAAARAKRDETAAKAAARSQAERQEKFGGRLSLAASRGRIVGGFQPSLSEAVCRHIQKVGDNDSYETLWLDYEHEDFALFKEHGLVSEWHGVVAHRLIERTIRTSKGIEKRMEPGMVNIISTPFKVERVIKDVATERRAAEIAWLPAEKDAEWQRGIYWLSDLLAKDTRKSVWDELMGKGLIIGAVKLSEIKRMVEKAADGGIRDEEIEIHEGTSRTGWIGEDSERNHYVTIGFQTPNAPEFIGQAIDPASTWSCKGDEQEYMRRMKDIVEGNPEVSLGCGVYASGTLLRPLGVKSYLYGLTGITSTGKSLLLRTVRAMACDPTDLPSFDGTSLSLRTMIAANNDSGFVLDEVGQSNMSDDQKAQFIYGVGNGTMRRRTTLATDGNRKLNEMEAFRSVTFFSGEKGLLSMSKAPPAGAEVRCIARYFDRNAGKPIWHSITTNDVADEWEEFICANHGWLMPKVIERIRELGIPTLRSRFKAILTYLRQHASDRGADIAALRQLSFYAAAQLAGEIICELLRADPTGLQELVLKLAGEMGTEQAERGSEPEHYENALRSCATDAKHFYLPAADKGGITPSTQRPNEDCWGEVKSLAPLEVVISKRFLKDFLKKHEIPEDRFINYAKDYGWLQFRVRGGEKKYSDSYRIGGAVQTAFRFVLKALEEPSYDGKSDDELYGPNDENIPF